MKQLVIGYGNTLRSDDGAGIVAARSLRELLGSPNCEVLELHQLSLELAKPISEAQFVVFLDASTEAIAGEIRYENVKAENVVPTSLSHQVSPHTLLTTAHALYGKAPEALLVTIAGECFGFGTQLTPIVQQSVDGVVKRVADLLQQRANGSTAASA